ncbi:MAG: glycosyltransferase family 4 protein [Bacteroidia bacterium]|nr:glycosyltransferase family 4 protein [Bacteroidia bacterium]
MNPPRILLLTALPAFDYGNPHSAVAVYLDGIRRALEARGWEVLLSHAPAGGPAPLPRTAGGGGWQHRFRTRLPGLYHSLRVWRYLRAQRALLKRLESADCTHILEFLTYGSDLGLRLSRRSGAQLHVIYDSPLNTQNYELYGVYTVFRGLIERRERASVAHAAGLICYSGAVRAYLAARTRLPARVLELPCLLWKPVPEPEPHPGELNIGFIGSFLVWHRVEWLIAAFNEVAGEFPEARLQLIGYGQEWPRMSALAQESPYAARIEVPGFVDDAALNAYKARMDIGVMPGSNWYGSPLKLFEYAQCGIAMIAPDTPTVRGIFEAETEALFVDAREPQRSLAAQLRRLLADAALRARLGAAARRKMETQYAPEAYYDRLAEALR